jgi:hypothetical protein
MSKCTRSRRAKTRREFTTSGGLITVPPGSPKILTDIHLLRTGEVENVSTTAVSLALIAACRGSLS